MTKQEYQNRVTAAIFDSDLVATRVVLALAETLWAVLLWWPGATFGRPTYTGMAAVLPEDAWGALFALSAVLQAHIALRHCKTDFYASAFAVWNAALWGFVVLSMFWSVQPPPAAIAGETALMCASFWIALRPVLLRRIYRRAYARIYSH